NVRQLLSDQRTWGENLEGAIDDLTVATTKVTQLPAAIDKWTNQLGGLVHELSNEHQAQTTVSQMTASVAQGLQQALQAIHGSSNDLRSIANDLYTVMNLQRDFPNHLQVAMGNLLNDFNRASQAVAQASQQLASAAHGLNGRRP